MWRTKKKMCSGKRKIQKHIDPLEEGCAYNYNIKNTDNKVKY